MNTYRLIPRIFRDRSISTNWVQIPLKQSRQVVHETVGCSNKNKTWQDWWHISHDTIDLFRRRMVTNGKGLLCSTSSRQANTSHKTVM